MGIMVSNSQGFCLQYSNGFMAVGPCFLDLVSQAHMLEVHTPSLFIRRSIRAYVNIE